jgi:hypothetical protein
MDFYARVSVKILPGRQKMGKDGQITIKFQNMA